nr:hypothetical protein [Tanacetum cinerariifolium]
MITPLERARDYESIGRLFDSAGGLYIPSATWTCRTQSADLALPRGLTWDLQANVAADVATTWQPLTHPLTGGQQPLTSVLEMVNGGPPSLTAVVDRRPRYCPCEERFRYEEEGSVRGLEGVIT